MKLAIYGREFNSSVLPYLQQVFDVLARLSIEVVVFEKFGQFISGKIDFAAPFQTFRREDSLKGMADILLSLGGDGSWDKGALDPTDPFTGNGYTSGGIPEFRNVSPSDINIGDQIWSYDKLGNQRLVAEYGPDGWMAVPR